MAVNNKKKVGGLVFTLKDGDSVSIGNEILIAVQKYTSNQYRMVIKAPKELQITRYEAVNIRELDDKIQSGDITDESLEVVRRRIPKLSK